MGIMPRQRRIAKGNVVYHVLNRASGRLKIFKKAGDFAAFEQILAEGVVRRGTLNVFVTLCV